MDFPTGKTLFPTTRLLWSLWQGDLGRYLFNTVMLSVQVHGFTSMKEVCLQTELTSAEQIMPPVHGSGKFSVDYCTLTETPLLWSILSTAYVVL